MNKTKLSEERDSSIYSIGHSTRSLDGFLELIERFRIQLLLDIRTIPRSRHVPQFNSASLERALQNHRVGYRHVKRLGGLRKPIHDSPNTGWRNLSFRGFADYMQTADFKKGLSGLLDLAAEKKVALMCAEAVPWRCHRSLISDSLLIRGIEVLHIISAKSVRLHELTPFVAVKGDRITYPKIADEGLPALVKNTT
ncbi:MAG: DUF488 domain-containing protein [Candidatus Binatia bacterium]